MVICLGILLCMGMLFIISGKEELPEEAAVPRGQQIFYKAAYFLLKLRNNSKRSAQYSEFETGCLAQILTVIVIGTAATITIQFFFVEKSSLLNGYELTRPEKGQGNKVQKLQVDIGEELQTEQMEIVLKEREYTQEEKQKFLDEAMEMLPKEILKENASPDEVRGKVGLPAKLANGKVSVQWILTPSDLLDGDGNIIKDISEEGELLQLHADLNCDGLEGFYECALRLFPPEYSPEERLIREVQKSVEAANEESAQDSVMNLPREAGGEMLIWSQKPKSMTGICLALTAVASMAIWIGRNREMQNRKESRSRQMLLDYPTLLFQLSMLLNAGMTMQNAFFKMALDYRNRKDDRVRYAYEEMLTAYYEMQSGVPEAKAYENFGKRCGESVYIKLGSMLSGNLQKGSQGLAKILQEEADFSMEERRQLAKKLGEEAGTKLLLPMMLMLLVVLVILMVPALLAF
ncbi:MAG: type II secretion system F family protein [Eubacteriales bacterium]|nr:type II secretion system F family protein [Eubacteriales bacterium]